MSQIYEAIRSFWLPEQAATSAHVIDAPFMFILIASTIMLIGVTFYLFYLPWKYRRRSSADVPYPVKENHLLEMSWIVIPTILVFIVFFWGFKAHVDTVVAPADAYEVNVQGKKWLWQFNYNEGITTTNELVVPANRPVKLIMNSVDVLHSFYVPEFRIKHDVLPNRYSTVWFEAVRADTFQILCTEYCGTGHSVMGAKVIALGAQEWNEWVASGGGKGIQPGDSPVELGEARYTKNVCNTCHSIDGSSKVGPSFLGHWGETRNFVDGGSAVMDEDYTRESILYPAAHIVEDYQPVMPSYQGQLSDGEVYALIQYIKSINGADVPATFAEGGFGGDGDAGGADAADDAAADAPAAE